MKRCIKCGCHVEDREPEIRTIIDFVPYGDRNVPMPSYEDDGKYYHCDNCDRDLYESEVFDGIEDVYGTLENDDIPDSMIDVIEEVLNSISVGTEEGLKRSKKLLDEMFAK